MPEGDDEIALELNQLKYFPRDIKVGDTIPLNIEILIFEMDELDASQEQTKRIVPELEKIAMSQGMEEPYNTVDLYEKYSMKYIRNIQSLEGFNGTQIGVNTRYIYKTINLKNNEEEESTDLLLKDIIKHGTMVKQKSYISRNMTVTGIFQTYSNLWDKSHNSVANAFITEDTGRYLLDEGYFLTEEINVSNYITPYHLFIDTKISPNDFYDKYNDDFKKLRINSYLYSEMENSTENILTYGILLSVFVATIFAVFLIYFTQIKRRTRRIALLKSIGATNDQIVKLLFWEICYLLIITIPIGLVGGIGVGKIILLITNKYGKTEINFHIDYRLTFLGITLGILAIFISMLAPMIMSMKIPLSGTISEPPKRKNIFMKFKKSKTKLKELSLDKRPKKSNHKIK